jgi:hypothetical protein
LLGLVRYIDRSYVLLLLEELMSSLSQIDKG